MKIIFIIAISIILHLSYLYSQKEINHWIIGNYVHLFFDDNSIQQFFDMNGYGVTGSSISDKYGKLLFYTNGFYVLNNKNNVMPNGDLQGYPSSFCDVVIVPNPSDTNMYYIFSADKYWDNPNHRGLYYAIVDMRLDSGRGDIIEKLTVLHSPVASKITAIRHSNGIDFWVIAHEQRSTVFLCYLISKDGIAGPIRNSVGSKIFINPDDEKKWSGNSEGELIASPYGNKIAQIIHPNQLIEIYDFDNLTGKISKPLTLTSNIINIPSAIEFSPDGTKLYVVGYISPIGRRLFQLDLNLNYPAKILNSLSEVLTNSTSFIDIKISPDGRILATYYKTPYLGLIQNPNATADKCQFIELGVDLNGFKADRLPNLISSYFKISTTVSADTSVCEGDDIVIKSDVKSPVSSTKYFWSGPDSLYSNEPNIVINNAKIENSGWYKLYTKLNGFQDWDSVYITVYPKPQPRITAESNTFCKDKPMKLSADKDYFAYHWSTGATAKEIEINKTGKYTLTVTDFNGCVNTADFEVTDMKEILVSFIGIDDLDFGAINVGENQVKQIRLRNNGIEAITLDNVFLVKNDDMQVVSISQSLPAIIGPNQKIDIDIEFEPKLTNLIIDTLTLSITEPCDKIYNFEVRGQGVTNIEYEVNEVKRNSLSPNPVTNHITLRFGEKGQSAIQQNAAIEIYNTFGQRVISLDSQANQRVSSRGGEYNLDVSSLPAGMYFVRAAFGSHVEVAKFAKW